MINISILLKQINKGITHCLFPYQCILCNDKANRELGLCIECEKSLPWLKNVCFYCASPLGFTTQSACGACLKKPLPFYKLCVLFSYTETIKKMMPYMIARNWLVSYATIEGLAMILFQMDHRTKNRVAMHESIVELKEFYSEFEDEFTQFFEEIRLHCKEKIATL